MTAAFFIVLVPYATASTLGVKVKELFYKTQSTFLEWQTLVLSLPQPRKIPAGGVAVEGSLTPAPEPPAFA